MVTLHWHTLAFAIDGAQADRPALAMVAQVGSAGCLYDTRRRAGPVWLPGVTLADFGIEVEQAVSGMPSGWPEPTPSRADELGIVSFCPKCDEAVCALPSILTGSEDARTRLARYAREHAEHCEG